MNKPLIIINCSKDKTSFPSIPIDLYCDKNSLSTLLKSPKNQNVLDRYQHQLHAGFRGFTPPKFFDICDVWVLSAEHGLINALQGEIKPYDTEMPKDAADLAAYVKQHKAKTRKTLKALDVKNRAVFVCMVNQYKTALESMAGTLLNEVTDYYINQGQVSIGDLRGRLKKVIEHIAFRWVRDCEKYSVNSVEPIVFASGANSAGEVEVYKSNRNNIGSSLHYINSNSNPTALQKIIDHANISARPLSSNFFLDNGFISNSNLDVGWVLDQYEQISKRVHKDNKLTIVLPDAIEANEAISILTQHKDQILRLCNSPLRVVLPVHGQKNVLAMRKHVKSLLEALDYNPNLIAGIPCLSERRYSMGQIEALLSIKAEGSDDTGWGGVHFLGLGKTGKRYKAYCRHLNIALIHRMKSVSFDSNRANAIWGSKVKLDRKGSKIINDIENQLNLTPSQRQEFQNVTESYDGKLLKTFYTEMLDVEISAKAIDLLNRHLPQNARIQLSSDVNTKEQLDRAIRRSSISYLRELNWIGISKKLIDELVECKLLTYDASKALGYYEKRRLSFNALARF